VYPSEHFIVAFLPALGYVLLRDGRLPSLQFVGVIFAGSQFPDLIDKPLAHQFGVLPSGRVFMHSLPIALPFLLVLGWYGWTTDRHRVGAAFAFAHLSHLLADNYRAFLGPRPTVPPDLLWPFTQHVSRPAVPAWGGTGGINVSLWTLFSVVVVATLCYLLVVDLRERSRLSR